MNSIIAWFSKNYFYITFYSSIVILVLLYFTRCFFKGNNLFGFLFKKKRIVRDKEEKS